MWFLNNQRDLPWRKTQNPYYIWLSEIILQQTRIQQGWSYYLKFIKHYPTVQDLASASEDEVLKDWQGLGYYSRARNLHFSAQYICNQLNGIFPQTYKDLLELKGVGDYTASAIASICFNEKAAVVDGNVYRVLSRYFNIDTPINSSQGIKYFKQLAQQLIEKANPGVYNQALMDFGAMICKPQNPDCKSCPLKDSCLALASNTIANLPVKLKKIKIQHRYLNFIVFENCDGKTFLEKRTDKGIWKNLYQFPLIESSNFIEEEGVLASKLLSNKKVKNIFLQYPKPILHKLTHQNLHINFWRIEIDTLNEANWIHWSETKKFAVPKPIEDFLNQTLEK